MRGTRLSCETAALSLQCSDCNVCVCCGVVCVCCGVVAALTALARRALLTMVHTCVCVCARATACVIVRTWKDGGGVGQLNASCSCPKTALTCASSSGTSARGASKTKVALDHRSHRLCRCTLTFDSRALALGSRMYELLTYHPTVHEKMKSGVSAIGWGINPAFPDTRSFFCRLEAGACVPRVCTHSPAAPPGRWLPQTRGV